MKVRPIPNPLDGEITLATYPELRPLDDSWHRRLNLFPGRSLDELDLTAEQDSRAGRLRLASATLSPGVVSGLEADLERIAPDAVFINVTAGFGIAPSGEDLAARTPLRFPLAELPVFTQGDPIRFADFIAANPDAPRAGVLLLQPAEVEEIAGFDPFDQCVLDPVSAGIPDAAFDDQRRVDAGRAFFFPWPQSIPLPLSPADPQFRNRLAWTIFRTQQQLQFGQFLPWESAGLPIGLFGFNDAWQPLFLDRYSVVRLGGKALRRPLLPSAGDCHLWQARILQFSEHANDPALAALPAAELAAHFAFVPPFGILPRTAADLPNRRFHFFSSSFEIEARPISLDQLDAMMRESAPLDPIQLTAEAQVQILVPVPPEFYEPRLLITEPLDPTFQLKLDAFLRRRSIELRRRLDLRNQANIINRAIVARDVVDINAPDPGALERDPAGASTEAVAPFPLDDHQNDYRFAYRVDANGRPVLDDAGAPQPFIQPLEDLRAALTNIPPLRTELPELNARGLQGFIDFLQSKADASDDTVTFGFLRVQADVYRLQKLMLGKQFTARLSTSSSLAFLQTLDDGDIDTKIRDFVTTLRAQRPSGLEPLSDVETAAEPRAPSLLSEEAVLPGLRANLALPIAGVALKPRPTAGISISPKVAPSSTVGGVSISTGGIVAPKAGVSIKDDIAIDVREGVKVLPEIFVPPPTTAPPVVVPPPISGARSELTNVTVDQRIAPPSAEQARHFTVGARAAIIDGLAALPINVDGIQATGITANNATLTLDQIRPQREQIAGRILAGDFDLLPANAGVDETAYFGAGVRALDQTIATLRGVEGRLQLYRNAIQLCRAALADLQGLAGRLNLRLAQVEVSIAEARQDVSVARMLLAEERERLRVINDRRARILAQEVRFLAFRRSRHANVVNSTFIRALDPGLVESPVPACLGRNAALPPELQDMVELLRDAPSRWFLFATPIIRRIDRIESIAATVLRAQQRAAIRVASPKAVAAGAVSLAPATKAVVSAFAAQESIVLEQRAVATQVTLPTITAWSQTRDLAAAVLSLGDLIDGGHNRPDITRDTSRELENIARIAGCLFQEFGDVPPAIRLDWAERFSQFDASVPLRDLSGLPRWGEIPVLDRKEIQKLVDWLFSRVDPRQQQAVNFMNDLVRVCLLVASYAPVNRIIAAEVVRPSPVTPGGRIDISVVAAPARLGMQVVLYAGRDVVAHGVVEDLVAGEAATRIVEVLRPNVTLAKGAVAQLLDPGRSPLTALR